MEPGNFNSHLSAIIWVVQLLVFYDSARKDLQGQGETLTLVKRRCETCLQQTVDTPMGEILRWRLLLFNISKNSVGTRQATWDEKEEILKVRRHGAAHVGHPKALTVGVPRVSSIAVRRSNVRHEWRSSYPCMGSEGQ